MGKFVSWSHRALKKAVDEAGGTAPRGADEGRKGVPRFQPPCHVTFCPPPSAGTFLCASEAPEI